MWSPTPKEYAAAVDAMLEHEWASGTRVTGMILTKASLDLIRRSRRTKWRCGPHDTAVLPRYLYGPGTDCVLIEGVADGRRITRRLSYIIPPDVDRLTYATLRAKAPNLKATQERTLDAARTLSKVEARRSQR